MATQTEFRLENDRIVTYSSRQVATARVSDVLQKLREELGGGNHITSTPILPKNCRAYFRQEGHDHYVIELPPAKHTFYWTEFDNEDIDVQMDEGHATVSMPWQYFLFNFKKIPDNGYGITHNLIEVRLFWALERMTDYSSNVFKAPMPNIDNHGGICLGSTVPESNVSPYNKIEEIVSGFYTEESLFNGDLGWELPHGSPENWENVTKTDINPWRNWSYPTARLLDWIGFDPLSDLANNSNSNQYETLASLLHRAVLETGDQPW